MTAERIFTSHADGTPVQLFPRVSNVDEANALLGLPTLGPDPDYADYVRRTVFEQEAGKHVRRMLGALLGGQPDFVPARDLSLLLAEYDWIASGNAAVMPLASQEAGNA